MNRLAFLTTEYRLDRLTRLRTDIMAPTWQLYQFKLFKAALTELETSVTRLAQEQPLTYKTHPKTRLLASVYQCITKRVPSNPEHPDFRLGKTLGAQYGHWRRVKNGMPDRYRLFFRFASSPLPLIVYVWFNDESSLRKAGVKTDVYEVFKRMLMRGVVPDSVETLLDNAK